MLRILFSTLLFVIHSSQVEAYSTGAPSSACGAMLPGHGPPAQTSTAPYVITTDKSMVLPGDELIVTLKASSSSPSSQFKGFLVLVQDQNSKQLTGFFATADIPSVARAVNCGISLGGDGALTHKSSVTKSSVTFTWTAPSSGVSSVKILATIVQSKNVFWTKLESAVVAVGVSTPTTTATTTATSAMVPVGVSTTTTTSTATATSVPPAASQATTSTTPATTTSQSNVVTGGDVIRLSVLTLGSCLTCLLLVL